MPQKQHIQLGLMIAHKHRRPRPPQPIPLVLNIKPDSGEEVHRPLEGSGRGPLPQTPVAGDVETCGGEGAVEGAEDEGEEGGDGAAVVGDFVLGCEGAEEDEALGDGEDGEDEREGG